MVSAVRTVLGDVSPTALGVSRDMVSTWRRRFLEHRLEGLVDEPRPGRPRTVGDDQVEQVVVKTVTAEHHRRHFHLHFTPTSTS
jgi:transposase